MKIKYFCNSCKKTTLHNFEVIEDNVFWFCLKCEDNKIQKLKKDTFTK